MVVTSTEWANFFALRHHSKAQPEIRVLAEAMFSEMTRSIPNVLNNGEWHLPFCTSYDIDYGLEHCIYKSVANCARVSYMNHDSTKPTYDQNKTLYERLLGVQPIHASPAEHQAMAIGDKDVKSGNFRGWIQFRKTLENESAKSFSPGMFDRE